jgi:hypothetical protein
VVPDHGESLIASTANAFTSRRFILSTPDLHPVRGRAALVRSKRAPQQDHSTRSPA